MLPDRPLVLVGAGNMGGAILRGWIKSDIDPATIYVSDPGLSSELQQYLDKHSIRHGAAMPDDMIASILMVAIKPQMMENVLPNFVSGVDDDTLIVSIAAGTTISKMKSFLPSGKIVRAMPNTPAMVGRGITGIAAEDGVSTNSREEITKLLEVCGPVAWLDNEEQIDAVTAVSGSGPAYVFLLAECMAEAGCKAGLDREIAMRLARETVSGAGELMRQSEDAANVLRENVTSPGGTTAAALSVLMADEGMQKLFDAAIAAAKLRSEELAKQ
ncbi:pyrroline-5-carboxylate reductase [Lentilitoribacter sp. EG35]|uniref:pyrroline-5-carboxylate reductase n=1 Tax=Lentilitoribacter sp. EG35 TaxID=3234192 RepID=UPI003460D88C